jgi:hypothetical protein
VFVRKTTTFVLTLVLAGAWGLASAQTQPNTLCDVREAKLKPGARAQFEAGLKAHWAWHRKQNDTWTWSVLEILTGPKQGGYYVFSCGHDWKDLASLDTNTAAHDADMAATIVPHVEAPLRSFWRYRPEFSRSFGADKGEPAYYSSTTLYLKPEGVAELEEGLRRYREIGEKAQFPRSSAWFQLVSGGEGPAFYQSQPRWTWADFEAPTPTFGAVVDEALGKSLADDLRHSVLSAVRYTVSEITKARPDLGYTPAKK